MRHSFLLLIALGLVACDGGGRNARPAAEPAPVMDDSITVTGSRAVKAAPDMEEAAAGADIGEDGVPAQQLAYEYAASLRLPSQAVGPVMSGHEAECREAGPKVCQVLYSTLTEQNAENVYGRLRIRAVKSYMDPFRNGLGDDAEEADGQLVTMTAEVEDLTRQITDTTARLEAQKTLRKRLLRLLEKDTDEVGDLLQIERELARVQGEIESTESWLKTLKARVAMDKLDIDYSSIPKAVTPQTAQPLRNALTSFLSDMAWSLAAVIRFIASLIPWLIVIIPGLWLLRAVWRNWRKRK